MDVERQPAYRPRGRAALVSTLVTIVATSLLPAGCTTTNETPRSPPLQKAPASALQLQASVVQRRVVEGSRQIDIRLTNRGDEPIQVEKARLDWAGVTGSLATSGTAYDSGRTIDLQTSYRRAVCDGEPTGTAEVVVSLDDSTSVRLPVDRSGTALLRRLHESDCHLEEIDSIAAINLSPIFERARSGPDRLLGSLVLRRTPQSRRENRRELSVQGFFGSVLVGLSYAGDGRLPVVLEADADVLEVPVALTSSNRCDPHARGQSTQTFLLSTYLRVSDVRSVQRLVIVPTMAVQQQVEALLDRVCG